MKTSFSFPLKPALLMVFHFTVGLACNFSGATTNTEATAAAQALQATQQAIDIQLTNASASALDAQATADTQNLNTQATATMQALYLLQTANALDAQATADAYYSQSNQQSQGGQNTTNTTSDVVFEVINQSAYTICRIYFSPPQADEWLNSDSYETNIPPDYKKDFYVQPGEYDLRVDDCSGGSIEEYYNIHIPTYDSWLVTAGSSSSGDEPLCGNGYCGDFENSGNCPQDCGSDVSVCGNGYCEWDETSYSCSADCGTCGDGYCGYFENSGNCPQDCGGYDGPLCGDGYCGDFENPGNCPQDCP